MKSTQQINPAGLRDQPLTGLHHAAINTRNITESIRYYSDVLGLKEAFRLMRDDHTISAVYLMITPGQYLELICGRTAGKKHLRFPKRLRSVFHKLSDHSEICHICLVTENIRNAYHTILASGGPVDSEIERGQSKCLRFWTHDPDGNRIEIMETPPESMQAQADKQFADSLTTEETDFGQG